MAAALLVVPALVAAWLWAAPRGRLRGLLAGGAAMAVVGLAWPLLMWLTPAADRPWISGTGDNSIWSLILGYNGLGRLFGQDGGPGGGMGGAMFGGEPGLLRLLNESLGGQGGWLLGVALVGGIAVAVLTRLDRRDARTGWLIAVGGTFLTTAVAFSRAEGIFHPYYVAQLAPFTAALVGAAVATMRSSSRLVAPAAILAGVAAELAILGSDAAWIAAAGVGAAVLLASGVPRGEGAHVRDRRRDRRPARGACRLVAADARPRDERDVPGRRPGHHRGLRRRPARRRRTRRRRRPAAAHLVAAAHPAVARPAGAEAACSAATPRRSLPPSSTRRPTAAARSPSPASPAPPAR